MPNDLSRAPSLSRPNGQLKDDFADEYFHIPQLGDVEPAPASIPEEEPVNEYVLPNLASQTGHSWTCQQYWDNKTYFFNDKIEPSIFSSIAIGGVNANFITPKKTRATFTGFDQFHLSDDDDSIDFVEKLLGSSNEPFNTVHRHSIHPKEDLKPVPVTPSTPLVITLKSTISNKAFHPPFPAEEQKNEYETRNVTSHKGHHWTCKQPLDNETCFFNDKIEPSTFSSITLDESDANFIAPKKNRAVCDTFDLFKLADDDEDSIDLVERLLSCSNEQFDGLAPTCPATPASPFEFGRLHHMDEYEYLSSTSPMSDFHSLVSRHIFVGGDEGVFSRLPLPVVSPRTIRNCPEKKSSAARPSRDAQQISLKRKSSMQKAMKIDTSAMSSVDIQQIANERITQQEGKFYSTSLFSEDVQQGAKKKNMKKNKSKEEGKIHSAALHNVEDFQQNAENKKKKKLPTNEELKQYVREVRETDVLFGRGGEINVHPGNIKYRQQIKREQENYSQAANRKEKSEIARRILTVLRHQGCRFLKQDETNFWFLVGDALMLEKIKQALRENYTPEQRQAKRQKYRK